MANLANWLAPAYDARLEDTAREIADDPTTVSVRRGGATLGPYTVRFEIDAGRGREVRSEGAAGVVDQVVILSLTDVVLQRDDRVLAADGTVYVVRVVNPTPPTRREVIAEAQR